MGADLVVLENCPGNLMKERTTQGLGVIQSSAVILVVQEVASCSPVGVEQNRSCRLGFDCHIVMKLGDGGGHRLVFCKGHVQKTNQVGLASKRNTEVVCVNGASDKCKCSMCLFHKYARLRMMISVTQKC